MRASPHVPAAREETRELLFDRHFHLRQEERIFALPQFPLYRIVRDVTPVVLELRRAAHDVVVGFALPESRTLSGWGSRVSSRDSLRTTLAKRLASYFLAREHLVDLSRR